MSEGIRMAVIGAEGLFVGGVTGFVGAGGGFLIIPALVLLVGLEMQRSIADSTWEAKSTGGSPMVARRASNPIR